MDKKELAQKIGQLLNVPENKYDFSFHLFLKNIASSLTNNQALKIPELGVFQLKKEPPVRGEEFTNLPPDHILFVPFGITGEKKENSLYSIFEAPDSSKPSLDFDENVFSPSVDKPIIPIGEDVKKETADDAQNLISNKLTELVNNSEILDDFQIWKEYSSVLEDDKEDFGSELSGEDIKKNGLLEENEDESSELEEKIDKKSDDWGWGEELEKELILKEEISVDDEEPESTLPEVDENKLKAKMAELSGETHSQLIEEDDDKEEAETETAVEEDAEAEADAGEEADSEEDPFKALEQTIIDEQADPVSEKEIEELVDKNGISSITGSAESGKELSSTKVERFEKEREKSGEESFFAKYKKYLLTAGVIVLFAWLFWPSGGEPVKKMKTGSADKVAEKPAGEDIVASFDDEQKTEKKSADTKTENGKEINKTPDKTVNKKKPETKKPGNIKRNKNVKSDNKIPPRVNLPHSGVMYKELTGDRNVGGNIFYDGNEYMVQVSSWRNNIIAEKEVQRMRKNGFDAFVVKAFVKKFKRTFYRVRIGGFKSKREALDFKRRNL